MKLVIPYPLKAEHEELHKMLEDAIKQGGKTGKTARKVASLMHPHFQKEEQYALPPLALLGSLAAGHVSREMESILPITDRLSAEIKKMLEEHSEIVLALAQLDRDASEENHPRVSEFARKLMLHTKMEEEIYYPSAILIGRYVKLKLK